MARRRAGLFRPASATSPLAPFDLGRWFPIRWPRMLHTSSPIVFAKESLRFCQINPQSWAREDFLDFSDLF